MTDPLAPYRWLEAVAEGRDNLLGDIFCVSFFRRHDPVEVLARFGPAEPSEMPFDELREKVAQFVEETEGGGGGYVGVIQAGDWSVAIELWGWQATLPEILAGLSQGCEVVVVGRHDYAEHSFVYAIDGEVVTGFSPYWPDTRWGSHPDRLNELIHEVGLPLQAVDEEWEVIRRGYADGISRVFWLADKITGVVFTPSILDGPLLVIA
ncbi:DUF6461 domain-containing protein [Nonomuraea mangrovi]|uniref:DUF6461 domain-containing protein n=1 Tax=Nonomuraea mangrovi TaxID=2316207 RepID=A0ABW4TFT0_9ACTN